VVLKQELRQHFGWSKITFNWTSVVLKLKGSDKKFRLRKAFNWTSVVLKLADGYILPGLDFTPFNWTSVVLKLGILYNW